MEEQQEKFKEFAVSIQDLIECPVCFGTMDFTLKQCINGHGVCSDCAKKIDKCPSCQQELIIRHNTLLGKIMECLPKLCPYSDNGCNIVVFDKEHQRFCEFRPFNCLNKACKWRGCVKYLIEHVKECYDDDELYQVSSFNTKLVKPFNLNESEYYPHKTPIIFEKQLFYCCIFQSKDLIEPGKIVSLYRFYHVPTSKPTCIYYLFASFKKGKFEFKITCKAKPVTFHTEVSGEVNDGIKDIDVILVMTESDLVRFSKPETYKLYEYSLELDSERSVEKNESVGVQKSVM